MTREELFDVLGDMDDTFIMEARKGTVYHAPKGNMLRGIAAACALVLVSVGAVWGIRTWSGTGADAVGTDTLPLLSWKGNTGEFVTRPVVTYGGAYYEILNMGDKASPDRYGLPDKITSDMVGEQMTEVRADSGDVFTLYQYTAYADVNQMAVYIASRDGAGEKGKKTYSFALFCNYLRENTALYDTAQKMFGIIGVYGADDITRVEIGDSVLDSQEDIRRFYDLLCTSDAMGEDGYQDNVFFKMPEKAQQALAIELADTAMEMRITTAHGFRACGLTYEPKIQYVGWACNHYRLSEPLV